MKKASNRAASLPAHQLADSQSPGVWSKLCGHRISDTWRWVGDYQRQRGSAPLRSGDSYRSQQFAEGFAFHGGDVAIVVKKNVVAAKLTRDDPPTTAEDPKLSFSLYQMPTLKPLMEFALGFSSSGIGIVPLFVALVATENDSQRKAKLPR